MTEMSRISAGQPVEVRAAPDKWALLDTLTLAAPRLGLNHRTLGVLRALLSFFPERGLPTGPGAAVVYPSNRTLSRRLNGMPESTLRRHLSTLVRLGLVSRQDSANRKRFACFGGLAFGFDLSPLSRAAHALCVAAEAEQQRRAELQALRARIAATRQRMVEDACLAPDHPLLEESRRILRRKTDPETLRALLTVLDNHLDDARKLAEPSPEMSGPGSENERHIQTTNESESVCTSDETAPVVPLSQIADRCREYRAFFPERLRSWQDAMKVAGDLYPMMGVDRSAYDEAQARIGRQGTAIVILCMLERMGDIRKPGAYLRGLCKRADDGRLNLKGMVAALGRRGLSADNPA